MSVRLLILDDDRLFCDAVAGDLADDGFDVVTAHSLADARGRNLEERFDVALLDYQLPDGSGLSILPELLRHNDKMKVILATAFPSVENAVAAMKSGVFDFVSKPVDFDELRVLIDRAARAAELEYVEQVQRYTRDRESHSASIIGSGPRFEEMRSLIEKAAGTNASVFLTGETGTGKNVVASAIHYASSRRDRAFISVNCAALPEGLIEAELFGVAKGAFTGASTTRKGAFELADGGTIFLDEIAEMPIALQSKLLTAIEERRIKRVGGDMSRTVDIRVIAATNDRIDDAIEARRFRSDLYFRLGVLHIHLPPLRERREDIPSLSAHFLEQFAPGSASTISPDELDRLVAYSWPGNVRELRNIVERAVILQEGSAIQPSRLLGAMGRSQPENVRMESKPILTLAEVERRHLLDALESCANNLTRTADALGISLSTLKRKLKEYGRR